MSISKELILQLNSINENVIKLIIQKIHIVFSDLMNMNDLYSRNWTNLIFNENFSSMLASFLFWSKLYGTQTPGEELSSTHYERKKSFVLYLIFLSLKGQIAQLIERLYKTVIEVRCPKALLMWLNLLWPSTETIKDLQLMYFFLNTKHFFNFLELIFNISLSAYMSQNKLSMFSKAIGYVILLKSIGKLINLISVSCNQILNSRSKREFSSNSNQNDKDKVLRLNTTNKHDVCSLCLNNYKDISATICGHLFCWNCIIDYLRGNHQCPQCRHTCYFFQVIFLQNY